LPLGSTSKDCFRDLSQTVRPPKHGFLYLALGFAVEQRVPDDVRAAFERLIEAGFTSRLVK
jgi:RNA processing factor Prp31